MNNQFDVNKLSDPGYYEDNVLPAHSDHNYFASEEEMIAGQTSFKFSLNGLWYVHVARNINECLDDFAKIEYDCKAWDTIRVPAHIQMEGYGKPHYTNTTYPWDGHEVIIPGEIPVKDNPVASYVKYFNVPEKWKELYISFQGAESAIAVWFNGNFVGYSEDSFTPADFDLTPYIVTGENKLAVQVFRYSSGSWLEDQDFWRFSGLFREVFIYTKPKLHLDDLFINAVPINDYTDGKLNIKFKWNSESDKNINIRLFDMNGNIVLNDWQSNIKGIESAYSIIIPNVKLWSAEEPNIYRAVIAVSNIDNEIQEVIPHYIGFREFKLDNNDKLMKINGKRIVFKGTDRHEFDCYNGRACDLKLIEQDIMEMKRNNINAIRCSHYPNSSRLYELCDLYGIYVIDEANLETHGTWMKNGGDYPDENTLPDDNPKWLEAVLVRAKNMLERDKNHPSILIWSCGNESFGGRTIFEMAEYFHQADPSRLVHYEGVFHDRRFNSSSDMESHMYTFVEDIKKFLAEHRDKPFICCEYTHSMGNSNGAMHKYTDLTDEEPLYQGGFIWDYVDQAIAVNDRYGNEAFLYGGDFDDRPSDYNFSGNGIVFANRKVTSKMQEVKFNYQNFQLIPDENGVTVINKSLFTNADKYDLKITLLKNGDNVWSRISSIKADPGEKKFVSVEWPYYGEGEYVFEASLVLHDDEKWACKGHEVAFGQSVCRNRKAKSGIEAWLSKNEMLVPNICMPVSSNLRIVKSDINIGVYGDGFSAMFSSAQGNMVSYKYNGIELIEEQPQLDFWRAPVDNDRGSGRQIEVALWKIASMYRRCICMEILENDNWNKVAKFFGENGMKEYRAENFSIRYTYQLFADKETTAVVTYTVNVDGGIKVEIDYNKIDELPELPDFAIMFTIPTEYSIIRYYGLGPCDNYRDRQRGARLGIFNSTVFAETEPYLRPQETGNHGGIRWFEVTDKRGRGIKLYSDVEFSASALPYTAHELENARHPYDLPSVNHTYIKASAGQCGVAGDNTWGAPVHDEYTLKNENRHLEFMFKGI